MLNEVCKISDTTVNGMGFILFHATTTPSHDMVHFSCQTLLHNYIPPKTNCHFLKFNEFENVKHSPITYNCNELL